MIEKSDFYGILETLKENFPKKRDGWDSPEIFIEISGPESGEIHFYIDDLEKFSADCDSMKGFDGADWKLRAVEWLDFTDQTLIMGNLVCREKLGGADLAMLDNWLKGMMEMVPAMAIEGIEMPEPVRAACLAWNEKGIFPESFQEKLEFANEFLDIENRACDMGISLSDPDREHDFYHGFSFTQEKPGGKIRMDAIWHGFTNQNGIDEDESRKIADISEKDFKERLDAILDGKISESAEFSRRITGPKA